MTTIHTIGHSTRPIGEFIALLQRSGVTRLVDIRTVPGSRHNPQYGEHALAEALTAAGISYHHLKQLGGLRPRQAHSTNTAWRNESFRNYADYMGTPEFEAGLAELLRLADQAPTAIMCAEAVPWRCHRRLVADALSARGVEVYEIIGEGEPQHHRLTDFAVVDGTRVSYPGEPG